MVQQMGLSRALFISLSLTSFLAIAACSGDAFDAKGAGGSSGGDAGACLGGQVSCSGQCVSASDPAFGCGSCTPCSLENATATCSSGACGVGQCQDGFADCDAKGGCETSLLDPLHCGQCNRTCGGGQVCEGGECKSGCSDGKADCGGSCVDPASDILHCGGCGKACKPVANALSVCASAVCGLACNPGFLDCDGQRDTGCEVISALDPKNCGACGLACKSGEICNGGKCELNCGGGSTQCGGKCVDLMTDENNCGACDKACVSGQNCVGGECKLNCGGGTTECSGTCVDTKIDPNNCGGCGNACAPGEVCKLGVCEPKCAVTLPTVVFKEEFAGANTGWGLDPTWEIKPAKVSSGHAYGFPDPGQDATSTGDNGLAGVIVGGNAPTAKADFRYLTSPAVNTLAAASLFVSWARWLNSDYEPYMKNVVEVFDGSGWVVIWQTGASPAVTDGQWVKQTFEISALKSTSTRVRFGYSVAAGAFVYSGWNLDDVTITAVTCN